MRSFFNRPAWASTTDDSASPEFYRRSQQTYSDIVAANRQQRESATGSHPERHHVEEEKALKRRRVSTSSVNKGSDSVHLVVDTELHCSTPRNFEGAIHAGTDIQRSVDLENGQKGCPDDVAENAVDTTSTAAFPVIADIECSTHEGVSFPGSSSKSTIKKCSITSEERPVPAEARLRFEENVGGNLSYRSEMARSGNIQECLDSRQLEDTRQDTYRSNYSLEDQVVQILITSEIENTKPLIVQRRMSQRLRDVRLAWCKRQGFGDEMTSSVFLTWKGKRLFDVTTCKSLGIDTSANTSNLWPSENDHCDESNGIRIHMEATTDELLKSRKRSLLHDSVQHTSDFVEREEDNAKDGFVRIILKSPDFDDLRIKVRPHTKFSHVIATFRDKKRISPDRKVQLLFDGELLDPDASVQDHEITDLDLVDVLVK